MARRRLVITRPLPVDPRDVIGSPALDLEVSPRDAPLPAGELRRLCADAEGVVSLLHDRIDASFFAACPRIRVVANYAVGYDNVDVEEARARGVIVTHTPGVLTDATADLTFALLLSAARRLPEGQRLVEGGDFDGWAPKMLLGLELRGATLGIVGFGRIGQAVARRALAFGMRLCVHTRSSLPVDFRRRDEVREADLAALLETSDVVSLHCPLTDETRHLLGAEELAAMKPGALLVNTARGPIVDERALVEALRSGHLGGAGLDVYEDEPALANGLAELESVTLLPHLGSATVKTRRAMAVMALEDAAAVLEGRPPLHPIPELC